MFDLVRVDRVAQAQHVGVGRQHVQPGAAVAVLHDDAVDHDPLVRAELQDEAGHAAASTSPRRPFMIAVLMSISGATEARPPSTARLWLADELGERDELGAQRHRQQVAVVHQILGEHAPEPLVVGDGAGELREGGAVGLVDGA